MSIIEAFPLSNVTLFLALLIPYGLAIYRKRRWFDVRAVRRTELLILGLTLILACAIVMKVVAMSASGSDLELRLFAILHLIALGHVPLLIKQSAGSLALVADHRTVTGGKDETMSSPEPLSKSGENLTWNDLIIEEKVKRDLFSVVALLKSPEDAYKYGIDTPKGILFQGPPGTGKTTIAKVVASAADLPFFVLRLDQITSQWFGQSEKNLTHFFETVKNSAPAVIFIDEVDSIGKARGSGAHAASDNLLNHLLQLIDGVIKVKGLYIIAATNRAELVDEALKRSGRLSKTIEIPLPDKLSRMKIFDLNLRKLPLDHGVNAERLASESSGMSGADIKEVCNQAGLNAFTRESSNGQRAYKITSADLEAALSEFKDLTSRKLA